jgi:GTP-binding protein HflX
VRLPHVDETDVRSSLDELRELSETAGFVFVSQLIQFRQEPDVTYFMGRGKLEEISRILGESVDVIIFNHDLSPSQIRNIEKLTGLRALTRTEVIIDIFAIHARTKAAKLQVELASLSYQMPRVIGKGIEMSRIEGGIGMKGPGEQQLELDRRKIRARIGAIKKELTHVSRERENQRKKRRGCDRKIAVVGYTNSGKSTLLNRLTKEHVATANKLFVTLDTTTRRFWLGGREYATITDTVGFIRDIPHGLIESFKSTFEDALMADLLIHVVDISAPDFENKRLIAENALNDMLDQPIPMLVVFNKSDKVSSLQVARIKMLYPDALFVSALKNHNIEMIRDRINVLMSVSTTMY